MIELMLRILLAIATNSACDMGKPADYYGWVNAHPDYKVPMTLSTESGDWWLMVDDGENLLFHFAEPLEATIPTGASHGDCARMVE